MARWDDVRTSLGDGAKPWVVTAAHEIVAACPYPIYWAWAYPGNGVSGDHPKGLALDIGNRDLGDGTTDGAGPERRHVQNWVKGYCLQHHARLGATFIVADDQIASKASDPDWTWREYDGSNPHTDHVHISFEASWTYQPPEEDVTEAEIEEIATRAATKVLAALGDKVWREYKFRDAGAWTGLTPQQTLVGLSGKGDADKDRDAELAFAIDDVDGGVEQILDIVDGEPPTQ